MIKANISFAKKTNGDTPYSSNSVLVSLECELPAGASSLELQDKIHETFELVRDSVDREMDSLSQPSQRPARHNNQSRNDNRRNSDSPATNKQVQYILSLGKDQRIGLPELNAMADKMAGVPTIYDLTKRQASQMVQDLQQMQQAA